MKKKREARQGPAGLVAFHASMRQSMAAEGGLTVSLATEIMQRLTMVHEWCDEQGVGIETLPPMSRRAACELTRIIMQAGEGKGCAETKSDLVPARAAANAFSIRGLVATVSGWLDRLAASRSPAPRTLFRQDALDWLGELDKKLIKRGGSIPALPEVQQRLLARVAAWCESPWHESIPGAAAVFEEALVAAMPRALFGLGAPVRPAVRYLPADGRLWKTERQAGVPVFTISELFLLDSSGDTPLRLARLLSGQAGRSASRERRAVRDWVHSPQVVSYILRLGRDLVHDRSLARGLVRDLDTLWQMINERDFGGRLTRPGLEWTRRVAHCRTGYYDSMTDRIAISMALDDETVPEYVVDFVLYHEMLHQAARLDILEGRGRVHDAAFRREEKRHARYDDAEKFLRTLASKR
jgi:hypothetical protein